MVVVAIAVIVVVAGHRVVNGMLMVLIRVHVVLIVELVVELWVSDMISLLFVDVMLVGLGVVSLVRVVVGDLVVRGHVVTHFSVEVMVRVTVVRVMIIAVVVFAVRIVMSVLIRSSLTTDVMCSDNAVLMAFVVVLSIEVRMDSDSSLVVMVAGHGFIHCVLMVVVGLNIVSMVKFMVKLRMCDVIGLLLIDIVSMGLRVVSLIVVIVVAAVVTMVRAIVALMGTVVSILVAHMRAVVRSRVEVVVIVLERRDLAIDVVSSHNAVLLLSFGVAVGMALLMIRVVVVVAGNSVIDSMLVVLIRMDIMLIIISVVERVVRLVIGGDVRVIAVLTAVAVEVALIRIIVSLKELNDRHVDVLGAHSVGLVDRRSAGRVQVLCHGDAVLGVEELSDRDLVLSHKGLNCLAVEEEVSDGSFHKFGHRDIVGSEVLSDRCLV